MTPTDTALSSKISYTKTYWTREYFIVSQESCRTLLQHHQRDRGDTARFVRMIDNHVAGIGAGTGNYQQGQHLRTTFSLGPLDSQILNKADTHAGFSQGVVLVHTDHIDPG